MNEGHKSPSQITQSRKDLADQENLLAKASLPKQKIRFLKLDNFSKKNRNFSKILSSALVWERLSGVK